MTSELIAALLALVGTIIGSFGGIMAANKLSNYRIEQLEKKVEKHNTVVERIALMEENQKAMWQSQDALRAAVEEIKKEVYRR